jgi:hypothetical protein
MKISQRDEYAFRSLLTNPGIAAEESLPVVRVTELARDETVTQIERSEKSRLLARRDAIAAR